MSSDKWSYEFENRKRKGIKVKRLKYRYDPESFALDDLLREVEKHFEEKLRRKVK